jgi:hypothetical protein
VFEGNPQKLELWLRVNQRKLKVVINYNEGEVEKVFDLRIMDEPYKKKNIPRELVDTLASNPHILVNGDFFRWTLTK